MAKLRPYLFLVMILGVGLIVGFFKFQNTARVQIDALFGAKLYDWALGDALVLAWVIGFSCGAFVVAMHLLVQKIETRRLARQVRQLEKQLEKARESARKDVTK